MARHPYGRHQVWDERSRGFALPPVELPKRPVLHERQIPIFDQGDLGCCTATALLGMLSTGRLALAGQHFTMDDARSVYHDETVIDDVEIPGEWPPDDTGSAGIYSARVAKARGWVKTYKHAFSVTTALGWLGRQPISIGVVWYNSMEDPDANGVITVDPSSGIAGGHQVCVDGIIPKSNMIRFANSWTASWGDHGYGWMTYADLEHLMRAGGDAVTVTEL